MEAPPCFPNCLLPFNHMTLLLCVSVMTRVATGNTRTSTLVQTGPIQVQVSGIPHLRQHFLLENLNCLLEALRFLSENPHFLLCVTASCPSSISEQTLCVLEKLLAAPDGRLDVRTLERHLVDVISIMEGFCLIQRKTAGHIQWM